MQLVGFRKKPPESDEENQENGAAALEKKKEEQPAEPEGVTQRVERMREEAHPKRQTKGKAHAPGVWIVYFSLAALPLFGLGQMLVPVADAGRRLWTFQLLCTYVAAGLGLLVTTSFVGLRRYLRQRGVQMPPQMAGVWIALGAAIIVVLLAICAILPRPAAEYQAARMPDFPFKFTTPERESNRHAMGKEGADKNSPDSQSRTQGEQDGTKPEGGKSDNPESGGEKGSNAKEGQGNKKSSDGKSQGSSKGDKQGEKKGESESKQDSSQSQKESSQQSPQDSKSGDKSNQQQGDSRQQRSEQNESKQEQSKNQGESGEKSQSSDSQRQRQENDQDSTDQKDESERTESKDPNDEEQAQTERREEDERSESKDRSEESREKSGSQDRRQEAERRDQEQKEEERSERSGSRSPGSQAEKPDSPPFQLPQVSLSGGLFGMLKFLVYVVLACVGAWWLWKNWSRVVEGFRLFLQELRELWASLFGGKRKSAEEGEEEGAPKARSERPFTDYVDPFSAGLAARYAPDELVRYTFEATEAWARENGCRRDPDQTPHEFAARIGRQVESLRPGAVALAKLYCQAAYAPGSLAPRGLQPLADFWQRLRASHGMVVPPPPPVQTPVG
jgi:hypothetical protein